MAPSALARRSSGVLLHLSSLPGPHGVGDLGPEAYRFIDFLYAASQRWWQMLPVNPPDPLGSPYNALSAFAGNPLFISLECLVQDGLLGGKVRALPQGPADFETAREAKQEAFQEAFHAFERRGAHGRFADFCRRNRSWLRDYSLFMALRHESRGRPWWLWDAPLRARQPRELAAAERRLRERARFESFLQYLFFSQWSALKAYAARKGISFIGDVPIFVARDCADVWAHPEYFWLREDGSPEKVAGVPPDYFSKDGQLWGNPLYRWDRLRERGYAWWVERLRRGFELFDAVRLDHFIGFHNYWEIPAGARTAREGRWAPGPGAEFFQVVGRRLGGRLELIAEDLGVVTGGVKALRDRFGFPGMRVLQFAFGKDPEAKNYLPHNHPRRCVAYTGTHDNDTIVGWFRDRGSARSTRSREEIRRERERALFYLGSDGAEIHWDMIRAALRSRADVAIVPAQDLLGLDSRARMNQPGSRARSNWRWRLEPGDPGAALAQRLRRMTEAYGRG